MKITIPVTFEYHCEYEEIDNDHSLFKISNPNDPWKILEKEHTVGITSTKNILSFINNPNAKNLSIILDEFYLSGLIINTAYLNHSIKGITPVPNIITNSIKLGDINNSDYQYNELVSKFKNDEFSFISINILDNYNFFNKSNLYEYHEKANLLFNSNNELIYMVPQFNFNLTYLHPSYQDLHSEQLNAKASINTLNFINKLIHLQKTTTIFDVKEFDSWLSGLTQDSRIAMLKGHIKKYNKNDFFQSEKLSFSLNVENKNIFNTSYQTALSLFPQNFNEQKIIHNVTNSLICNELKIYEYLSLNMNVFYSGFLYNYNLTHVQIIKNLQSFIDFNKLSNKIPEKNDIIESNPNRKMKI